MPGPGDWRLGNTGIYKPRYISRLDRDATFADSLAGYLFISKAFGEYPTSMALTLYAGAKLWN